MNVVNEGTNPSKSKKKYKCPYCNKHDTRDILVRHVELKHSDLIPEGYTPTRVIYNSINHRENGSCIMCHNITEWDENKNKYNAFCSEKCKNDYVKMCRERNKKKYGKENLLDDPEQQIKMLSNRRISGIYQFTTGGKVPYVGSYEKNFLEFIDVVLHIKSIELVSSYPILEYTYEGKVHTFIPDYYYVPYNLVLDIKDGGNNPNKRSMPDYRAKQLAKEKSIVEKNKYNYIRLTDNNFEQLLSIFMELKELSLNDEEFRSNKKHIHHINEHTTTIGTIVGSNVDEMQRYPNRVYMVLANIKGVQPKIGITKDKTMTNMIFSNDEFKLEAKGLQYLQDSDYKLLEYTDNGVEYKYSLLLRYLQEGKIFTDKDIYNLFLEKDLLDYNQPLYENDLVPTVSYLEKLAIIESTITSTILGEDYIPLYTIEESSVPYGMDLDGYFVINEESGVRSKSYHSKEDIPDIVIELINS